jgi:hypothetical protein
VWGDGGVVSYALILHGSRCVTDVNTMRGILDVRLSQRKA